jgi:type I restriction enzyme S subunit
MEKVKLGQLTNIKTGRLDVNAENPNGKYPFFTCSKNHTYIDEYAFDGESVLVAGNGDLNVKYYNGKFNAYQRTYVIQANENLNGKFLYYFLDSYVEKLREQSIGGVIKYIKLGNLTDAEIPLPNLATQQRIAAILDQADAIIQNNRAIVQKYDALTQSLFLDMFGDPVKNEKKWEKKNGVEYSNKISVGVVIKPASNYVDEGVIALRSLNVKPNKIDLTDLVFFSKEAHNNELSKSKLNKGDVVIIRTGSTGTAAIIPEELDNINCIDLIIVKPNLKFINPKYLVYFFNSERGKNLVSGHEVGGIQKHFNIGSIKKIEIPTPPIELQNQFAERVAVIEAQKQQAQLELAKSEELFQSLLQRAFNGELS